MRETMLLAMLVLSLPAAAQPQEPTKLFLEDAERQDFLGTSADLSADTAIVGAPGRGTTGAAYVYDRDAGGPGVWGEVRELEASDLTGFDGFGDAVALSGDTFVVGASDAPIIGGAAYVYERPTWSEVKLISHAPISAGRFGCSTAIDGDTILVGEREGGDSAFDRPGRAFLFERIDGAWAPTRQLEPDDGLDDDNFGVSVSISGDTAVVGADDANPNDLVDAGAAYVYERDQGGPGNWGQVATLVASDSAPGVHFGVSVSIAGDVIVVGAHLDSPNGIPVAGSAYVFERDLGGAGAWGERTKLIASDAEAVDGFGRRTAIWGDRIAVGAPGADSGSAASGAVYLFERDAGGPGAWGEVGLILGGELASGSSGFGSALGLAGNTLLSADPGEDLYSIKALRGSAYHSGTGTLYATDVGSDRLFELAVPATSTWYFATSIGPLGFDQVEGLTFAPSSGTLFGTDIATDQLITVDPSTGQGTAVGPLGFDEVRSLAFSPSANTLWGVDTATGLLITIDPITGQGTAVGPTGVANLEGLAYDSSTATLFGVEEATSDGLYTIDTGSGSATFVKNLGVWNVHGLASDPSMSSLRGAQGSAQVFSIAVGSLLTQTTTLVSATDAAGAAYVIELTTDAETYCTAGTSASGCQALIGSTGLASATAPSGFVLNASGSEGQKNGLFFFGSNGRQANPWGNGTSYQCVAPPVKRTALLSGGGTAGQCDATYARDLNTVWCPSCPKAHQNPGAGAVVQAQLWYRDPQNTSNQSTSLSDAVEFTVSP